MRHDPLTLHEIDMHIRRAHELRASYEADFPGKLLDAIKVRKASWPLLVAATAGAILALGGYVTIATAH